MVRQVYIIDWDRSLSQKFSLYMVTSYLYYELNKSVINDTDYDRLCKELAEGYDAFEHQHKHLVDKAQFVAGTGYAIKYPMMVRDAANDMLGRFCER